jgi:hypothetical protein
MTPSGIEPATFRCVAQYLIYCATISGPHIYIYINTHKETQYTVPFNFCLYSKFCVEIWILIREVPDSVPGTDACCPAEDSRDSPQSFQIDMHLI